MATVCLDVASAPHQPGCQGAALFAENKRNYGVLCEASEVSWQGDDALVYYLLQPVPDLDSGVPECKLDPAAAR